VSVAARDVLAFGLHLRSSIEVPGAVPVADGPPDLTIGFGAIPIPDGGRTLPPYTLTEHGFVFAMPELARYRHEDGHITIDPLSDADPEMLAAMLIATMLPATIWARGGFMLHAAVAIPPGAMRGIAVAGPSGSGKSTLLARMVAQGWTVVAEDSAALEHRAEGVFATGLPGIVWRCESEDRSRRRAEDVPPAQQSRGAPIAAVVHLDEALAGDAPVLAALPQIKAVEAMLANRHRPGLPFLMRIEGKTLPVVIAMCGGIASYRLTGGDPARIALQHLAALVSPDG